VRFDDGAGVLTVDGEDTKVGEQAHLLGSGGPLTQYPNLEWAKRPDKSCDTEQIWFVGLDDD
jgi:hypothetical protein